MSLPKNVANGIQALAAVLPAARKNEAPREKDATREASGLAPLPSSPDEPTQELCPEKDDYNPDFEPFIMEDIMDDTDVLDLVMVDSLVDASSLSQDDFDFASLESIDFDSGSLDDLTFDTDNFVPTQDSASPPSPTVRTPQETSRKTGPRLSRSLLLDFYRLPSPSPDQSSPDDLESLLIQHYFKDVCAVFSSFDSAFNPFRTTIGRIYQDSPSIKYAIQSMAAAHLANTFPNMARVGVEFQQRARDALDAELPLAQCGQANITKTFLSIMLLGLTTSWHNSGALGLEYLSTARSLILPKLLCRSDEAETQKEAQFFEESLIHWEMLMGFVTEDARSFSSPLDVRSRRVANKTAPTACRPDGKIVPHPWTGIAPMVQFLFAEVGRLVRRERSLNKDSARDYKRREENLLNAVSLEEDLLAVEYPSLDQVADTGDERTPKEHFTILAETYRCAGLLELYRTFPSILRTRLGTDDFAGIVNSTFQSPTLRFDTPYEDTDTKLWLNSLAMHILRSMESLPSSSGTFCVQPLLLVVAASELKYVSSVDFFDVNANNSKIRVAREFVSRRLQEYSLRLPNKPVRQMMQLIKETWRQSDSGQDVFWIDIMNEKGWHTIM